MKLLAQMGWGKGDRINRGLQAGVIDGVIFSPKDEGPEKAMKLFTELNESNPQAFRLFDPQLYILTFAANPNLRPGKIEEYGDFYPGSVSRRELERQEAVEQIVANALDFQIGINASHLIAPGVLVPTSVDSVWGSIARNFVRAAGRNTKRAGEKKVLATLALDSDALSNRDEMDDLLQELTIEEERPHGFYLLVSFREGDLRSNLTGRIFANWLMVVHALAENGFDVVVGYSDYLSCFFGLAGATAGATGWFENLRNFSTSRFMPESTGGRQPLPRYSSPVLLNRILVTELRSSRMLEELESHPSFRGEYSGDDINRTIEILQHWTAVRNTFDLINSSDLETGIASAIEWISIADSCYGRLREMIINLDPKSDDRHLEAIEEGLIEFRRLISS